VAKNEVISLITVKSDQTANRHILTNAGGTSAERGTGEFNQIKRVRKKGTLVVVGPWDDFTPIITEDLLGEKKTKPSLRRRERNSCVDLEPGRSNSRRAEREGEDPASLLGVIAFKLTDGPRQILFEGFNECSADWRPLKGVEAKGGLHCGKAGQGAQMPHGRKSRD